MVKGIVVDICGNPLIGAVVTERGMNNSTTTDREGYFLLRVRKGRSVLEVSSEGMKTKKIKVRKKKATKIKVVLRKDKHSYKQTMNANL
ncbi:carboxypeptidase-like regulatory domain-containing protein [Bacteroides thetaiotaomicron]|nr:carboxypeptidase-like regulatory domain-containing protein [Bacteroides thetaiotaomicron]